MRVERLYTDSKAAIDALRGAYLVSEAITVESNSGKILAIAAASAFERDVGEAIKNFAHSASSGNSYFTSLIYEKIVNRQFHTLFEWKSVSASSFFLLFGSEARRHYAINVKADVQLSQGVRDFLDLGNSRNEIVHRDYITYDFTKTTEDVIRQYRSALYFVNFLTTFLEHASRGASLELRPEGADPSNETMTEL